MDDLSIFRACKDRRRDCFGKFRFVFKLMGMSLESNQSVSYKLYSLVLILLPIFSYPLIRVLDLFLMSDTTNIYQRVLYPFAGISVFLKSIVFLRIRAKLSKLLIKLEEEPFLPNPKRGNEGEEVKLQENCRQIIKRQSIIYAAAIIGFVTVLAIVPLIKRIISSNSDDWVFPYRQVTLVDVTRSPNYELWWFYENLSIYILAAHFVVIDTVVAAVLTYVTFQFKMLQSNIKRIVEMSYNEMLKEFVNFQSTGESSVVDASTIPWKYLKKCLAHSINYHLAILNAAGEIEEVFNGFMLYLFLDTLGLMAVFAGDTTLIAKGGTCVSCGQLLGSCFWAEQLMYESHQVGRAAFDANFVGADLRFQKSLVLIIRRSQNPIVITAGKFSAVCLSTFTWILRAGYSASTVLSQLQ